MEYIDLHVHTTASDGMFSPKEVVRWAHKKNLKAIAITDHDTIDGIQEALIEGEKLGIKVIPGIEINTDYRGLEVHILGYYIDYKEPWFNDLLKEIRLARYNRAKKMIEKLNSLGIAISLEEVVEIAGTASIGRPHIARILEKNYVVQNSKEAFEKYIGMNQPAYVERYKITPSEAIKVILRCKGIPILAHPGLIKDYSIVRELVGSGLQGIEVFHTKHSEEDIYLLSKMAKQYDLIITGGSDCHGVLYNNQPILGSLNISRHYLDRLEDKLATLRRNNQLIKNDN